MHLYLIRHGHAEAGRVDAARRLSKRGRRQVRVMARFLRQRALTPPAAIWYSRLVRARETGELLAKRMKLGADLVEIAGIEPGANPARVARHLRAANRPLAIVGHEPHLSALASLLVVGAAEPPVFVLPKGAVLALERQGERWLVLWQLPPELLA